MDNWDDFNKNKGFKIARLNICIILANLNSLQSNLLDGIIDINLFYRDMVKYICK